MSWEEMNVSEEKCPCGKGKIITRCFDDDWNRIKTTREIDCNYCSKNYTFINNPHATLVTIRQAREIESQKIAEMEKHKVEQYAKYHEEYKRNLSSFNRSVKIVTKRYPQYCTYNDKSFDFSIFLSLPQEVQEIALGSAKGKSPYCLKVISLVPRKYWAMISLIWKIKKMTEIIHLNDFSHCRFYY